MLAAAVIAGGGAAGVATKDRRDRQGRGSGPRHPRRSGIFRQRRIIPGSRPRAATAALQKVGKGSGKGSGRRATAAGARAGADTKAPGGGLGRGRRAAGDAGSVVSGVTGKGGSVTGGNLSGTSEASRTASAAP